MFVPGMVQAVKRLVLIATGAFYDVLKRGLSLGSIMESLPPMGQHSHYHYHHSHLHLTEAPPVKTPESPFKKTFSDICVFSYTYTPTNTEHIM